jgi:hypothetical protein
MSNAAERLSAIGQVAGRAGGSFQPVDFDFLRQRLFLRRDVILGMFLAWAAR